MEGYGCECVSVGVVGERGVGRGWRVCGVRGGAGIPLHTHGPLSKLSPHATLTP